MTREINLRAFGPSTVPSRLVVLHHTPVLTVYDVDSEEEEPGTEIHGDESQEEACRWDTTDNDQARPRTPPQL